MLPESPVAEASLGRGGPAERLLRCRRAEQDLLGLVRPPRLGRDPAQRQPDRSDGAVGSDIHRGGDRHQREGIGDPVAHLSVAGIGRDRQHGKFDGGDEFVSLQLGFEVRSGAG